MERLRLHGAEGNTDPVQPDVFLAALKPLSGRGC